MKLFTTDKTVLMELSTLAAHKDGLVLEGTIMGAMPLKAVLRPEELRAGVRLVSLKLIWFLLKMLVRGKV